jgi:hypothetical protein
MRLTLEDVIKNARSVGYARRFPESGDPRIRNGVIFSEIAPHFSFAKGASIFTLGSCFARNVEEKLIGFSLPTMRLAVPASERPGRPNGILNEYNPGTMCQRLEYAANGQSFGDLCIAPEGKGFVDLLLPEYVTPTTKERLMQRRAQVDDVYAFLSTSNGIIITFDVVEAWYDNATGLYVNRLPPADVLLADRKRFEMRILDVHETLGLLERMMNALTAMGVNKILLSVSPVPLETTYSGTDCVMANNYSKSVLVVSANTLSQRHQEVDYFPGYEIVTSAGRENFDADQIHVRDDVVELVSNYLVKKYVT